LKKLGKKGISTVFGAVFFIILIFALQTTLFLAVYRYNNSIQEAIKTENERIQEKIVLIALLTENSTGVENIHTLVVNNTGTITVRIRAIYIDNQFICDPSTFQGDSYINPKEMAKQIPMPPGVPYNPTSKITAATERGTKTTDYEWKLKQAGGGRPPYEPHRFYLGPLMLDFTKFYYAYVDPQTGEFLSPVVWRPGWHVFTGTGAIAWNITVKNVDDRDITINQFSVFTLWPNDQPSSRRPWYIEPPPNSLTQRINSKEIVQIIYKWTTPKKDPTETPNTQSIYKTPCRCRIFLTFFGIFHEHDGTTKPYGQTIPFEAVLVEKATIQVTASPTVIATNSPMYSTITAVVMKSGNPVVGENVTFATTAGSLSSSLATTDDTGTARVYLTAGMYPTTATVTATWITISGSTTVRFTNLYVTTDRQSYAQNDTVKISGLLRDVNGTPIKGVVVSLNVTASNGTVIWSFSSTQTDSNGAFTYDLQLINATPDTYTIIATYKTYEEKYHKFTVT